MGAWVDPIAEEATPKGPASYRNWRAEVSGAPARGRWETPLYSDGRVLGGIADGGGPYVVSYSFPVDERDPCHLLLATSHLSDAIPRLEKTNTDSFTGASLADEIACLLALQAGARIAAGSTTRSLIRDDQWLTMGDKERPIFFPARPAKGRVIPSAASDKTIGLGLLAGLPRLPPDAATSLIRAARAYRDGLLVAEAEPELSWLLFVSALEVAAVHHQVDTASAADLLLAAKPELVAALDAQSVELVGKAFSREFRATGRFLSFMVEFMPDPPERRPPEGRAKLSWDVSNLKACLSTVYNHRSRALHEATPFPPLLCEPPMLLGGYLAEAIVFTGAATMGGAWAEKDLPFPLSTFEYLTRGALLKWWERLVNDLANTLPPRIEVKPL